MNYKNELSTSNENYNMLKQSLEFHEHPRVKNCYFTYPRSSSSGRIKEEREMNAIAVNGKIDRFWETKNEN